MAGKTRTKPGSTVKRRIVKKRGRKETRGKATERERASKRKRAAKRGTASTRRNAPKTPDRAPTGDGTAEGRLEVIREVLRNPIRVRIVGSMRHAACTQAELARTLLLSNPTIHHHLKVLKGAGLVSHVGTRPGPNGITEKLYKARVDDWKALCRNPSREIDFDFMLDYVVAWMQEIHRDGAKCVKKDYVDPWVVGCNGCHASDRDIARLNRRIMKLIEGFCDSRKAKKKGTKPFAATFAVMPIANEGLMLQKRIFDYAPQR